LILNIPGCPVSEEEGSGLRLNAEQAPHGNSVLEVAKEQGRMVPFEVRRAYSVEEAVATLGSVADARLLAGGMTLIPALKHRLSSPSILVDLSRIGSLRAIQGNARGRPGLWRLGAGVRHAEVAAHPGLNREHPALCALAAGIGDPQVRARGTLGGALANNDPAADYPAAVLGLDAQILTDRRSIAAADYFCGMFTTALEDDEVITAVEFAAPRGAAYRKFPHPATGYAMAGVFLARLASGDLRVAVTGVAPGVFRWLDAESALEEGHPVPRLMRNDLLEDMHAPAAYRAHLAGVMLKRALEDFPVGRTS
jgi:carbon-monoxide dehydrogenase medium subunit